MHSFSTLFFSSRLYLINSPVVKAENLRFKEEGVRDVLKDVLLPWYNAYRFFIQNVLRLQKVGLRCYGRGSTLPSWVELGLCGTIGGGLHRGAT